MIKKMAAAFRCRCSVDCQLSLLSGLNLYHALCDNVSVYSCGQEQLDEMLKGGLYSNEFTEIVGTIGSGKSQFCLAFVATLIANTNGRVLFIDTTGSFSVFRVAEILLAKHSTFEMKVSALLARVIYEKSYCQKQLNEILDSVCRNVEGIRNNLKAIIIDHVGTILSPTLVQARLRGMQDMMRTAMKLRDLAKCYNLCVLAVNNGVEKENGDLQPSLGSWWASIPDTRLLLTSLDDNLFSAQLLRSARSDCSASVRFSIDAQGLVLPCSSE
uniref:RECA_2 domain-containing protein n=1 Tax=Trichuris muris TaxID=70415 RepID=A0A5S6QM10_TRIMR